MKICIYLESYICGGVDTVIVNKINNWPDPKDEIVLVCNRSNSGLESVLKNRIKRKHRLVISSVITLPDIYAKYLPKQPVLEFSFKVFWLYLRYFLLCFNIAKLFILFKQLAPDIVFSHNGGYPGADSNRAAVISAKLAGVKRIFMIVHHIASVPRVPLLPLEFMVDKLMDNFSQIICVSDITKQALLKNRNIKQNILVIYNGTEKIGELSKEEINKLRSIYGVSVDSKIIGMVGTYEEIKGHKDFFISLDILKRGGKLDNTKCLIFGTGTMEEQERIKESIVKYGLKDAVKLCGFDPNIYRYFKLFDIFAFPSKYESFGMVIIEAMAAGVPVVSYDVGAAREIILDGVNGFIVQLNNVDIFADRLRQILEDRELSLRMGIAAKKHFYSNFTSAHMANKYYNLIEDYDSNRKRNQKIDISARL